MKPVGHLVAAGAASAAVFAATGEGDLATACLVGGVALDLDHAFDFCYLLGPGAGARALWRQDVGALWRARSPRIFLLLHAWEWVAALGAWGWAAGAPWALFFGLGAALHLALDQGTNGARPLGYFFLYRLRHRFEEGRVFYQPFSRGAGVLDRPDGT